MALRLGLTQEAPAGYRAGVVLANAATVLSLSAMGAVTLRTYLAGPSPALRTKLVGLPRVASPLATTWASWLDKTACWT